MTTRARLALLAAGVAAAAGLLLGAPAAATAHGVPASAVVESPPATTPTPSPAPAAGDAFGRLLPWIIVGIGVTALGFVGFMLQVQITSDRSKL